MSVSSNTVTNNLGTVDAENVNVTINASASRGKTLTCLAIANSLDMAGCSVIFVSDENSISVLNHRFLRNFGRSPDRICITNVQELINHPSIINGDRFYDTVILDVHQREFYYLEEILSLIGEAKRVFTIKPY